jgi:integrase
MLRARRLDDDGVASLKAKPKRQTIPDPELRGHYIRITPSGSKSFWVVARDNHGKQVWKMIGSPPMSIDDARAKAQKTIRAIRSTTVIEAANDTSFEIVASAWYQRHIIKNDLSAAHTRMTRDMLRRHIVPAFAGMNFVDVRRKHVSALLDKVEDDCGARTADYALSTITGICTWYAKRDEDYASPIIKGMKRCATPDRDRILSESEVRDLWSADGFFGNFTKFALLTAQRREKLMTMRFDDVRKGVWYIRSEEREKGTGEELALPQMALDIIEAQRTLNPGSPFVFAYQTGSSPRGKLTQLDQKFKSSRNWPHWQIHDLRRTARSLMAAAGVPTLHAELVMGHKQRGVVGIYDRHQYRAEKAEALKLLAAKIRDIVSPPPSNVRKLRRGVMFA